MIEQNDLLAAARLVREKAHAPYSLFRVGAAIRGASGRIYSGANVENAAFPQGQCAEASAIGAMIAHGEKHIAEILVLANSAEICAPCGGCRQRLREFGFDETIVYLANPAGIQQQIKLKDLLPLSFGPANLPSTKNLNHPAISLMDLTSLNDDDTDAKIQQLAQRATTPAGPVAALCVYSKFLVTAKKSLPYSMIRLATVVNFPGGNLAATKITQDVSFALDLGAEEIDLVIPYHLYRQDPSTANRSLVRTLVERTKKQIGAGRVLKVILETGVLQDDRLIEMAAQDCVDGGTDFLKTSTGKTPVGATITAVKTLLQVIQKNQQSGRQVGCKISGGVRQPSEADQYLMLVEKMMGKDWINPANLRFGASSLLDQLLNTSSKTVNQGY
jgi:deoxyribose-phosphate aldolase